MTLSQWISWVVKPTLFTVALIPAGGLAYGFYHEILTAASLDSVSRTTGEWAVRFLLLTLILTPLRERFNLKWLSKFRRMLGLFAFFYANLHMMTYVRLGDRNTLALVVEDIADRPFVVLGMAAYVLMCPLAITSLNVVIEWMGKERWRKLQRTIYVIGTLAILHMLSQLDVEFLTPIFYLLVFGSLLVYRSWSKQQYLNKKAST